MDQVTKAIEFAAEAHDGMVRKKDKTPYILHPLEAAVIVGSMTDNRDVISAAVHHDVVEDTEITIEEIEEKFGSRVRALVESETEDKRAELPPEATWRIRKEESLNELKNNKGAMEIYTNAMNLAWNAYADLQKLGFKNEITRYVLPNACETKIVMTMNIRSLLHLFEERCCNRAQWEIREMAYKMLSKCEQVAPNLFANAGASCVRGKCKEGKMSCGKPIGGK